MYSYVNNSTCSIGNGFRSEHLLQPPQYPTTDVSRLGSAEKYPSIRISRDTPHCSSYGAKPAICFGQICNHIRILVAAIVIVSGAHCPCQACNAFSGYAVSRDGR